MTRSEPARIFYSAYSMVTGARVSGDAANHTVKYSAGTSWTTLSVTPAELSDGVYTFELPAAYTDVETAVCMVSTTTSGIVIPVIELSFYEGNVNLNAESCSSVAEAVGALTVSGSMTLSSAAAQTASMVSAVSGSVTAIQEKLDYYPAGSQVVVKSDIPTVASIVNQLLITDVTTMPSPGPYSLTAMVLGGFCSTIDSASNTWTISTPSGTVIATRQITTSDTLRPIASVR